jgi:hypothetical protein
MTSKEDRNMTTTELTRHAQAGFTNLSNLPVNAVIGLAKREDVWVVSLEAVERKAIPDSMDVLGIYEIRMDSKGILLGFERMKLRKRGETKEE